MAIIVFNATLREFIRSGAERYEFDVNNVLTSASLLDRLLWEAGEQFKTSGNFKEDRQARIELAERVLLTNRTSPIFDVLFVDEAQDFLPREISLFRRITRDIFMVADTRQRIYAGESPMTELKAAWMMCLRFGIIIVMGRKFVR